MGADEELDRLGVVFRWSDAHAAGVSQPRLGRLLDRGVVERLGHGLYLRTGASPLDLDRVEAAMASPSATMCLASALVHHDLVDEIPSQLHVAVPRSRHVPLTSQSLQWHRFADATFEVGRDVLALDGGLRLGIYSPERSIVDAYRLRHRYGVELAREALRSWLRRGGTLPSALLAVAGSFPKAEKRLREDLQVLL